MAATEKKHSHEEVHNTENAAHVEAKKTYNVLSQFTADKSYFPGDKVSLDPTKKTTQHLLTNKIIK